MFKTTLSLLTSLCVIITLMSCQTVDLKSVAISGQNAQNKSTTQARSKVSNTIQDQKPEETWASFLEDGLHDPEGPAFEILQRPAEALASFPKDAVGNRVNWVKALNEGFIDPRTNIYPETNINVLDLDIFLSLNGALPIVKFPHRQHTQWLDCSNCHDKIFKAEAGATKFSMNDILNGFYCGQCHGAVSFPLTECNRCHSVSHSNFQSILDATEHKAVARPKPPRKGQ